MRVRQFKKTGRNEICPCQPKERKTIEKPNGEKVTFFAYKSGGKKYKDCHGKKPVKYVNINTNFDLAIARKNDEVGLVGV